MNKVLFAIIIIALIFSLGCNKSTQKSNNKSTTKGSNTSNAVKIGTQEWMTENLNVERYRNGDIIPQVQDSKEWSKLTTGAWCSYGNEAENGETYGKLYNWYAVDDPRGLAPAGWHIPSDKEWSILTTFLGGEEVAGGKMKSTSSWFEDGSGSNTSGFTAIPAGLRNLDGEFYGIGKFSDFWSSSKSDNISYFASHRSLSSFSGKNFLNRGIIYMRSGFSVRCVRD